MDSSANGKKIPLEGGLTSSNDRKVDEVSLQGQTTSKTGVWASGVGTCNQ